MALRAASHPANVLDRYDWQTFAVNSLIVILSEGESFAREWLT